MKKPQIFISYSWGNEKYPEETEAIDAICSELSKREYDYVRDIKYLQYLDNLPNFLKTIGTGGYVICIVGEKYFKSDNCLIEASYMMLKNEFNSNSNIFPITLSNLSGVYDRTDKSTILRELNSKWNHNKESIESALKEINYPSGIENTRKDLAEIGQVINQLDKFIAFIGNNLQKSFGEQHKEDFETLFTKLEKQIVEDYKSIQNEPTSFYKRYPNEYIGRKESIDILSNFLGDENEHFFLFCGVGGMGKSHLLSIVLENFEDKQIIWEECNKNFHLKDLFALCRLEYSEKKSVEQLHKVLLDAICTEDYVIILDDYYEIIDVEVRNLLPKLINLPAGKVLLVSRAIPKELDNIGQTFLYYFLPPLEKEEFKQQIQNYIADNRYSKIKDSEYELIYKVANGYPLGGQLILDIVHLGDTLEDVLIDLPSFEAEKDPEGKYFSGRLLDNIFKKGNGKEIKLLTEFSAFFEPVDKKAIRSLPNFNQVAFQSLLNRRNFIWKIGEDKFGMHAMKKDFAYSKLINKENIHKTIANYFTKTLLNNKTIKAVILNSVLNHLKECNEEEISKFKKTLENNFNIKNIKSLIRDDIEKTILNYKNLISFYPYKISYYTELGKAYLKRNESGDIDEAITTHLKALEIDKTNLHSYTELGQAYLKRNESGDIDEAIKTYKEGLKIEKDNLHFRTELGKAYLKRNESGDIDEAIKTYKEALEIDKTHLHSHTELGKAYLKRNESGDIDEAIKTYKEGLKIEEDNLHFRTELGKAYLKRNESGDTDEAIKTFKEGLKIEEDNLHFRTELGKAYLKRNESGDIDEAITAHLKALEIDKTHLHSYTELGKAYLKRNESGDIDEAITAHLKALEIDKTHLHSYTELGKAYLKRNESGDIDEAIKTYKEGLKIEKDNLHFRTELGKAYLKRNESGDIDEAIKTYKEALEIDKTHLHSHTELGKAYLKRNESGDINEAIKTYKEGLKIEEDNPYFNIGLLRVYLFFKPNKLKSENYYDKVRLNKRDGNYFKKFILNLYDIYDFKIDEPSVYRQFTRYLLQYHSYGYLIKFLHHLNKIEPNNPNTILRLGRTYSNKSINDGDNGIVYIIQAILLFDKEGNEDQAIDSIFILLNVMINYKMFEDFKTQNQKYSSRVNMYSNYYRVLAKYHTEINSAEEIVIEKFKRAVELCENSEECRNILNLFITYLDFKNNSEYNDLKMNLKRKLQRTRCISNSG